MAAYLGTVTASTATEPLVSEEFDKALVLAQAYGTDDLRRMSAEVLAHDTRIDTLYTRAIYIGTALSVAAFICFAPAFFFAKSDVRWALCMIGMFAAPIGMAIALFITATAKPPHPEVSIQGLETALRLRERNATIRQALESLAVTNAPG